METKEFRRVITLITNTHMQIAFSQLEGVSEAIRNGTLTKMSTSIISIEGQTLNEHFESLDWDLEDVYSEIKNNFFECNTTDQQEVTKKNYKLLLSEFKEEIRRYDYYLLRWVFDKLQNCVNKYFDIQSNEGFAAHQLSGTTGRFEGKQNKFNGQPLEDVYNHFSQLCAKKPRGKSSPFLTQAQLDDFIQRAFIDNKPALEKININKGTQGGAAIQRVFNDYWNSIRDGGDYFSRNENSKEDYCRLITDYFEHFTFDKVMNNFSRHKMN